MLRNIIPVVSFLTLFCQCKTQSDDTDDTVKTVWKHQINVIPTSIQVGIRGLHVVDSLTTWISAQKGTWGKTEDGGNTWIFDSISDAQGLDFRSLFAFDKNSALVLTAGSPALLFKTTNGGRSWETVYENSNADVFFDGMKFWDKERGLAFGDPMDGKLFLIYTNDGGSTWSEVPKDNIPPSLGTEAGFAASGTGIWLGNNGVAYIGLGGEKARVFKSTDYGISWTVHETPVQHGTGSKGIYSLDFLNDLNGIAAGGDYTAPEANNNVAYTRNGGKTWTLSKTMVEYKECVKFLPDPYTLCAVALGPSGLDFSTNQGLTWNNMDTVTGFHVIDFQKESSKGWMAGSNGKIAKIKFYKEQSQ